MGATATFKDSASSEASYLGGALYDLHGDYVWAFAAAALSGGINLLILSGLVLRLGMARRNALLPENPRNASI